MSRELKKEIRNIIAEGSNTLSLYAIIEKVRQNPSFHRIPHQIITIKAKEILDELSRNSGNELNKRSQENTTAADDFFSQNFTWKFDSIGGFEKPKKMLTEFINANIKSIEGFTHLGFERTLRGILICGAEGTGKTSLAKAICAEAELKYIYVSKGSKKLKSIFSQGTNFEKLKTDPCIVIIDELDLFFLEEKSEDLQSLSEFFEATKNERIFVIGLIRRAELLPGRFFGPGKFELKVDLPLPDEFERQKILRCLLVNKKHRVDVELISRETSGFVLGDLVTLMFKAAENCILRSPVILENFVTTDDFLHALKSVRPIFVQQGFNSIPKVTFEDVGALDEHKEILTKLILRPIAEPLICARYGIKRTAGVLLWGPPGCGKTLLAKAIASTAKANFIYVKGPELFSKYVGDSEKAVRGLFERARMSAPCLIFFDEIDGLVPRRSNSENNVAERVVNQMLTEMNGLEDLEQVYIIGATNRPDIIDSAILRPERLGVHLYVPLPDKSARLSILEALTRHKPLAPDVDLNKLVESCDLERFSGADLALIIDNASRNAAWNASPTGLIHYVHFKDAFETAKPSISDREISVINELKKNFS